MSEEQTDPTKAQRHRSPRSPFIPLSKAVSRAAEFYKVHRDHVAKLSAANVSWGMKVGSGAGAQTIAALRQYGLMQDAADGIKLTDLALRIVRDTRDVSPERVGALREAVLNPTIFAEMLTKWPAGLPPDADVQFYLVHERGFSEDAAKGVLANFKGSFEYANIEVSDIIADNERGASLGRGGNAASKNPNVAPPQSAKIMEGERIVFTHEVEPQHGVRILALGQVDESVLDALELYVQLQKKRLDRERLAPKQGE